MGNTAIDYLAIGLVITIMIMPIWQISGMAARAALLFNSPDSVLNDIYWKQHQEKEKRHAELSAITGLVDEADKESAARLATNLPTLDEALARLQSAGEAGHVDQAEQQRLLARLGKVVNRMDETKMRARELQVAELQGKVAMAETARL